MVVPVTHHSEHHTITRADARAAGVPDSAAFVVYWLSDDAQSDMVVGWGRSHGEAVDDAQHECSAQELAGGSLAVYDVA